MLDVEVHGAEAEGLALQRQLPAMCADAVSPALEAALAPLDAAGAHLVIDVLEVDVGEIPLDRLEAALAEQLRRELSEYVRRHVIDDAPADEGAPAQASVRRRSDAERIDEALLEFLRTGRLPWWVRLPPGALLEDIVQDAWRAADPTGTPPAATVRRLTALLAAPRVRARLVAQFSPQFAVVLLRAGSPAVAVAAGEAMAALGPERLPAAHRRAMVQRVWDAALVAAANSDPTSAAALARAAWSALEPTERADPALATLLERTWPGVTSRQGESAEASIALAPERAEEERPRDIAEGIVVENAGLVLLHPFLPQFFDALHVGAGGELIDPERALCLLHHLATGETVAPEHRLALAKVLCGIPLDRPVAADVGLTADEIVEAEALLEAIVGHWAALGHASPAALRGEFLARAGLLSVDADGDWVLRVEARTLDILLDRLPWGIALVRTPWMRRLLKVEWR